MSLIVQKFGGTSVRDAKRIRNVAGIIAETYLAGNDRDCGPLAQGDTTDDLIAKAEEINPHASKREMDMLLSTGEQISCSLCAMAIEAMGYQVVSLTGWQAGVNTDSAYGGARIKRIAQHIDTDRFMVTYGDGVSDINISELVDFHIKSGKMATFTGVRMLPASVPSRPMKTGTSCLGRKSPSWTNTSTAGSSCSSANSLTIFLRTSPAISKRSRSNALPPKAAFHVPPHRFLAVHGYLA